MYHHVLVPLDGSDYAELALEPARAIAEAMGARITVIAVALRFPESRIHVPALDAQARERTEAYLQEVSSRLGAPGVPVDLEARQGVPAVEILAAAREHDVDLIVMTTHGARGSTGTTLGSTAWRVVQEAVCPVLLTRARASTGA